MSAAVSAELRAPSADCVGRDSSEALGLASIGSLYFNVRFRVTLPDPAAGESVVVDANTGQTVDRVKREVFSVAGESLKGLAFCGCVLALSETELLDVAYRKIGVAVERVEELRGADPATSEPLPLLLLPLARTSTPARHGAATAAATSPWRGGRSVQFVGGPLATTPPSRTFAEAAQRPVSPSSPLSRVASSPEIRMPQPQPPRSPMARSGLAGNDCSSAAEKPAAPAWISVSKPREERSGVVAGAAKIAVTPATPTTPEKKPHKKKHHHHHHHRRDRQQLETSGSPSLSPEPLADASPMRLSEAGCSSSSFSSSPTPRSLMLSLEDTPERADSAPTSPRIEPRAGEKLPESFAALDGLCPLVSICDGFVRDPLAPDVSPLELSPEALPFDDPEVLVPWYRKHIKPAADHWTFYGALEKGGDVVVSVAAMTESDPPQQGAWRVLLRHRGGDVKRIAKTKPAKQPPIKDLCRAVAPNIKIKGLTLAKNTEEVEAALLHYEDRQRVRSFKFGVVLCRAGDVVEDQMFGNNDDGAGGDYGEFLKLLGERIQLRGWEGYRAGLDVKNGDTGEESVYTVFRGLEIMYHVATMLPDQKHDSQKVERKRHIGNDIVVIIFNEGTEPIRADTFHSEFNHVFAVVQKVGGLYRLEIFFKDGVKQFGPKSPTPLAFADPPLFREFLLSKLINAEISAYSAPGFRYTIQRTRVEFLRTLAEALASSK